MRVELWWSWPRQQDLKSKYVVKGRRHWVGLCLQVQYRPEILSKPTLRTNAEQAASQALSMTMSCMRNSKHFCEHDFASTGAIAASCLHTRCLHTLSEEQALSHHACDSCQHTYVSVRYNTPAIFHTIFILQQIASSMHAAADQCRLDCLACRPARANTTPTCAAISHPVAYFCVHSFAVFIAPALSCLKCLATSSDKGSSGLGALSNACIEISTVRICSAGDHLSFRISRQMRPSLSMLG